MNHVHRFSSDQPSTSAIAAWIGLVLLLLVSAGCNSLSGPGSASFASVTIQNHSSEEIAAATANVFAANGYAGGARGPEKMMFEREASRGTTLAREGVVATQGGARTLIRVRLELVWLSENSYRLQCQAYTVTGAGDSFFEEEVRLANVRSGPYQSLLNKVAKELK